MKKQIVKANSTAERVITSVIAVVIAATYVLAFLAITPNAHNGRGDPLSTIRTASSPLAQPATDKLPAEQIRAEAMAPSDMQLPALAFAR